MKFKVCQVGPGLFEIREELSDPGGPCKYVTPLLGVDHADPGKALQCLEWMLWDAMAAVGKAKRFPSEIVQIPSRGLRTPRSRDEG